MSSRVIASVNLSNYFIFFSAAYINQYGNGGSGLPLSFRESRSSTGKAAGPYDLLGQSQSPWILKLVQWDYKVLNSGEVRHELN